MSKIHNALKEIHQADRQVQKENFFYTIHPCVKLLVTMAYLLAVVSFQKYNLSGLLGMSVYLIFVFSLGEISFQNTLQKLGKLLILLFLLGIANLFADRSVITHWGNIPVTGGAFSFLTLYLKGVFALLASYSLIMTTGMESICYGLLKFHLPKMLVTVILLIYRYLILFMKEVERLSLAYSMRAPGQRGIHIKAWGSMVGALLLRSIDRAEIVYESMQLRGFSGSMMLENKEQISMRKSAMYGMIMGMLVLLLRVVPVFE